jgi:hypothetical protein
MKQNVVTFWKAIEETTGGSLRRMIQHFENAILSLCRKSDQFIKTHFVENMVESQKPPMVFSLLY